MAYDTLIVERDGPVGWLVFNRPDAANAMDARMMQELEAAWRELDDDASVRVIVNTGTGRAFQTGLDMVAVGYSLGLAASVLWLGALGDRYGRKMLLLLGGGLSISNAVVGLFVQATSTDTRFALDATGTVALTGYDDVAVSGTFRARNVTR